MSRRRATMNEIYDILAAFPQEDPIITGVEMQYQIGDEITLNCTSGKSHPASILHWYINEQQVTSQGALIRYPPIHHRQGLITTTLGLRFTLSSRHFQGGSMKVKCIASVSPSLLRTDRESIVQNLPIKDMREALLLGEWTTFIQSPWHAKPNSRPTSRFLLAEQSASRLVGQTYSRYISSRNLIGTAAPLKCCFLL
ncbi:hypothetical protein Zmor_005447 [Zophobas morio]|uniref:CD80-like immunoglobulin C2-set domain-containing protein n=1 Tax=Zophobas morio TaxID=2755281 RepID=A0AA38MLR7_9CUCU|nr:hypothetical protein Zmor_005447 [Zophobas morio]